MEHEEQQGIFKKSIAELEQQNKTLINQVHDMKTEQQET